MSIETDGFGTILQGTRHPSVDNAAALIAADTDELKEGDLRYVESFGRYFLYRPTATNAALTAEILVPSSGNGRWFSTEVCNPKWVLQPEWYVDYTAGDDENAGTSGAPIKTIREWFRRTRGFIADNTSMFLVGSNWPATDGFFYTVNSSTGSNPFPILFVTGTRTVVHSGTLSTSANRNAASNLAHIISNTSVASWTPYVNKMIVITSGASTGVLSFIAKDLGGNQARLSPWYDPNAFATASTPAAGSSYAVVDLTAIDFFPKMLSGAYILATNLDFRGGCSFESFRYIAQGCRFTGGILLDFKGGQFLGCGFSGASAPLRWILDDGSKASFYASLFTTRTGSLGSALATYGEVVIQGESIGAGFSNAGQASGHIQVTGTLGIFDSANPIYVDKGGIASIGASLYGSGNTTGIQLVNGAKCIIAPGITPTIACTTQISLPGGANQIPALTAGASVPAASACSTFAQWAAAPFNRFVMSYKDGSALISGS